MSFNKIMGKFHHQIIKEEECPHNIWDSHKVKEWEWDSLTMEEEDLTMEHPCIDLLLDNNFIIQLYFRKFMNEILSENKKSINQMHF